MCRAFLNKRYVSQVLAPIPWSWTIRFSGPRHTISIYAFHSSVFDIFYEPIGSSPGSTTEEVQTVAVG